MGIHVFSECTALKKAVIGSGLDELPAQTFCSCSQLQSVTLPKTVTKIGNRVFEGCAALKEIALPDSLQSIGDYAFQHSNIENLTLHCERIGEGAFKDSGLKEIILDEGVQTIGKAAFSGSQLKTLAIPASVTKIDLPMLTDSGEDGLTAYSVAENNPAYCSVDSALYNKSKTK